MKLILGYFAKKDFHEKLTSAPTYAIQIVRLYSIYDFGLHITFESKPHFSSEKVLDSGGHIHM